MLLNVIGYDVVMIGNNEGLGLMYVVLNWLYDCVNFDVVFDNLIDIVM